tara:strand:+ start:215 stop:1024 length:810 start_codon:yes stop_codon:yes gene_type:complete
MENNWEKTNKIYDLSDKGHIYLDSEWNEKFRNETLRLLKEKKIINNDVVDLENLHNHVIDKSLMDYDFGSGVNGITKNLYDLDEEFLKIYKEFIKDLHEKLGFDFYFQDAPTIRVHCPNTKNQNHYPRYHSDCFYGHPPQEINMWFSLTANKDSGFNVLDFDNSKKWYKEVDYNTETFIKKAINSKEFNETGDSLSFKVESNLNNIFLFDSLMIHTNQPRLDDTRVSIDMRINPVDGFVDGYVGAGRMKAEFKPGGKFGYSEKSIKNTI